ncbi:hypothetical protein V1290_002933 [Bradyrhizobium sp. AZCC 1578]|uniref:hypothetical protein n=1 Tax=Bradyrhizobium sp. AZCC 1578 TaxID=3117027 RepID=UPI002FF1F897
MTGTVIFIVWVWIIVFLFAAIPGVVIGWVASAMLGYRRGIIVSVMISIGATIFAIQKGLPGSYLYLPPFLVAALLGVWISRRTLRVRKWLPLAIMLVLAAAYGGPLLLTYITNGEQDECSFGPVSNVQYRDYLRRAKELSSNTPGSFTSNDQEARARFDELFERLIDGKPSVYERVAASHALLRSFGAQYRNTNVRPDPYETVARKGGFVSFSYYLDINRLGVGLFNPLLIFRRTTYISALLTGPGDFYRGPVPSVVGDIRFNVNYPAFDTRPPDDRAPENCPLVPSQALSESFSHTTR